jgi:hypothetical protein
VLDGPRGTSDPNSVLPAVSVGTGRISAGFVP